MFVFFLTPKINKMKVRFWTKMVFFGPKVGPEPNFHLGPGPHFQKCPFYQMLVFELL